MATYSAETRYEVWNDEDGSVLKVGPDSDALDLVAIVEVDTSGARREIVTMEPEQALLVAAAIERAARDLLAKKAG